MSRWVRMSSLPTRLLVYVAVATLAFGLAAGAGAIGALALRGGLTTPGGEEPGYPSKQVAAPRPDRDEGAAQRSEAAGHASMTQKPQEEDANREELAAPRQDEAEYVARIGDIQSEAVTTFRDSHEKLLRYDALTADDVEKMQGNEATLARLLDEADNLDPPSRYTQQHETFKSGIDRLHRAVSLASELAGDPMTATQSGFDEYDRLVGEAAVDLKRSNDALGRNYASIKGVQKVNPLS